MKNVLLQIEGMSCGHCFKAIEGALKEIGAAGQVDLVNKKVAVSENNGRFD